MTEKRQTSHGYIIRILQHFATKLWNITNFVTLFQAVMTILSRSKFSLYCKWSINAFKILQFERIYLKKSNIYKETTRREDADRTLINELKSNDIISEHLRT